MLVPNHAGRYEVGYRSKLTLDDDGGFTLVYATERPPEVAEENWLPLPAGRRRFTAILRAYLPRAEVRSGAWTPPAVVPDARRRASRRRLLLAEPGAHDEVGWCSASSTALSRSSERVLRVASSAAGQVVCRFGQKLNMQAGVAGSMIPRFLNVSRTAVQLACQPISRSGHVSDMCPEQRMTVLSPHLVLLSGAAASDSVPVWADELQANETNFDDSRPADNFGDADPLPEMTESIERTRTGWTVGAPAGRPHQHRDAKRCTLPDRCRRFRTDPLRPDRRSPRYSSQGARSASTPVTTAVWSPAIQCCASGRQPTNLNLTSRC